MMAVRRSTRTASAAPTPPVRRPTPYERIKEAIMTGELAEGQPAVETALAQWCKVSRTPIREALTRLEQDGLLIRSYRGLIVRERSPEEILDIYETRILLEASAARTAAARRSQLDVLVLRRTAQKFSEIDSTDQVALTTGNRDFHRTVWQSSHNESLIDVLDRLNSHLARYPATTLSQPGRWKEANAEHLAIVNAIEKQDLELAHELSAKHFTRARDIRLDIWAQGQR
jgi:DNA-binding GntR family transcriptional regulator